MTACPTSSCRGSSTGSSAARVGQGSGLGLAIAKAYANAHGGDLLYTPRTTAARFELILPRTQ